MNWLALPLSLMLLAVVAELGCIAWRQKRPAPWLDAIFNLNSGHVLLWVFRGIEVWVYGVVYHYASLNVTAVLLTWAQWLLAFVAWDFGFYVLHYAHHKLPWLWAVHVVHHTGREFNLSLGIRNSWYSSLTSIPFFVWMAILGFTPTQFLLVSVLHYAIQLGNHNHFYTRPTWLDKVLVTAYSHRVHHGKHAAYRDKNFGSCLNIWDKLFGTHQTPLADAPLDLGTGDSVSATHDPYRANQEPFYRLLHRAMPSVAQHPCKPSVALASTGGILLFMTVIYFIAYEFAWQTWQAVFWIIGIALATLAIGRYSDGSRNALIAWCGLALVLSLWLMAQGTDGWRFLLATLLFFHALYSGAVLLIQSHHRQSVL